MERYRTFLKTFATTLQNNPSRLNSGDPRCVDRLRMQLRDAIFESVGMERDRTAILEEALSHIVGNTCRLSRTSACYGWNAKGPGARELMSCLAEQSEELHQALVPLAAHMRNLGLPVVLDYSDVTMTIDPPSERLVPILEDMVTTLVRGHEEACISLRAAIDLSAEIEEHATTFILAHRLEAHRTHIRVLSAERA